MSATEAGHDTPPKADTKDTNPKDAVGVTKLPYSTLSPQVIAEVGVAMLEGALKYGRHNYRVAGVRASVYFDACLRHLTAWYEGQDTDPDSSMSHIVKAMACLMVVRDSQLQGNWVDDRPPRAKDQDWQGKLNATVKALLTKYPNPPPAKTQVGQEREAHDTSDTCPSDCRWCALERAASPTERHAPTCPKLFGGGCNCTPTPL